jgi:excisionase family DNA binding protein
MMTVPEAARRTGKNPETIRRWIREGRLAAHKVGTQHIIDEAALDAITDDGRLPVPDGWRVTSAGEPVPNIVAALRQSRASH